MRFITFVIYPILIVCLILTSTVCVAQESRPLSSHATGIKKRLDRLSRGEQIRVSRPDESDQLGVFVSEQADDFSLAISQAAPALKIRYEDVSRVKVVKSHQATGDHGMRKHAIVAVIILGGLFGIAYAAASAQ